jgi:hypothetical protein
MVSRNADQQRRLRGLVLTQAWATPEQAAAIRRIAPSGAAGGAK